MTRLEKIARDLAAVLSPKGEADWEGFVGMAEEVGTRLYQQFAQTIAPEGGRPVTLGASATAQTGHLDQRLAA